MSKKLFLVTALTVISFGGIAQDIIDERIFLNEYKYYLSRIEFIAVSKVYLQSNSINDEDHSEIKRYLSNKSHNLKSIISRSYISNQFDYFSERNNQISINEIIIINEQNFLNNLAKVPADVRDIVESTNQLFDSLKTFEDYEDPITKFLASEKLERQVIPKIENILSMIEKTMIHESKKNNTSKLRLDYNEIELEKLLIENERLIKELESISFQWKNASNYKGKIPFFQQFDDIQSEIMMQLEKINVYLFYHKYLGNKKKISKNDFKELIISPTDTAYYQLRDKIFNNISSIQGLVSLVKNSIKNVEQGVDESDPITAFLVAEAKEEQEEYFENMKLHLLKLSNLISDR